MKILLSGLQRDFDVETPDRADHLQRAAKQRNQGVEEAIELGRNPDDHSKCPTYGHPVAFA